MTTFSPPVEVPADVLNWMRTAGRKSAFVAAMWNTYQRSGGLTQKQLDMLIAAKAAEGLAKEIHHDHKTSQTFAARR